MGLDAPIEITCQRMNDEWIISYFIDVIKNKHLQKKSNFNFEMIFLDIKKSNHEIIKKISVLRWLQELFYGFGLTNIQVLRSVHSAGYSWVVGAKVSSNGLFTFRLMSYAERFCGALLQQV